MTKRHGLQNTGLRLLRASQQAKPRNDVGVQCFATLSPCLRIPVSQYI